MDNLLFYQFFYKRDSTIKPIIRAPIAIPRLNPISSIPITSLLFRGHII